MRKIVSSGSPFEPQIGFSRAVRVGAFVAVSGTAPIAPGGGVAAPGDFYGQTRRCLEIIAKEEDFRHVKDKIHIRSETDADVGAIAEVTAAAVRTLAISNHTEQFIIEGVPQEVFLALSLGGHVPQGIVDFHKGFKTEGQQEDAGDA